MGQPEVRSVLDDYLEKPAPRKPFVRLFTVSSHNEACEPEGCWMLTNATAVFGLHHGRVPGQCVLRGPDGCSWTVLGEVEDVEHLLAGALS